MRTRLVTRGGDTISLRAEDGEESEEAAVHGWLGRRYSTVQYSTVQYSWLGRRTVFRPSTSAVRATHHWRRLRAWLLQGHRAGSHCDVKLVAGDGELEVNSLVAALLLPELAACEPAELETVLLPDTALAELSQRLDCLLGAAVTSAEDKGDVEAGSSVVSDEGPAMEKESRKEDGGHRCQVCGDR